MPAPVILTSWVGYDTDGRTDIGWWDTLRPAAAHEADATRPPARRRSRPLAEGAAIAARIATALEAVDAQIAAAPATPDPDAVAAFAHAMVEGREAALTTPAPLDALFRDAIAAAPEPAKLQLAVARAGLRSHGLSLAHTHVRLNSSQLHNVVRQRLDLSDPPEDPSRRRVLLAGINAALDTVQPVPVDYGALIAEGASAARLMMTVAQLVKHIDGATPVRFLIAETESGYTLLAALWLAKLFGIEQDDRDQPAVRDGGGAGSRASVCWRRRCAARITATTCKPRASWRCSSATRIPAAMSARWRRLT